VEQLNKGNSSVHIDGDLDYTLRAFPNHHKALVSLVRYYLQGERDYSVPPPECYLQRALKFRPQDGVVWMVYGVYLHRLGRYQTALDYYKKAVELMPQSSEAHYDLGLLYIDLKQYDQAIEHAHKAYALGFPLPGLRNQLKKAGRWP
jgi:tetratricopeptide (TPR) repeat protein